MKLVITRVKYQSIKSKVTGHYHFSKISYLVEIIVTV